VGGRHVRLDVLSAAPPGRWRRRAVSARIVAEVISSPVVAAPDRSTPATSPVASCGGSNGREPEGVELEHPSASRRGPAAPGIPGDTVHAPHPQGGEGLGLRFQGDPIAVPAGQYHPGQHPASKSSAATNDGGDRDGSGGRRQEPHRPPTPGWRRHCGCWWCHRAHPEVGHDARDCGSGSGGTVLPLITGIAYPPAMGMTRPDRLLQPAQLRSVLAGIR
jgi:hypothetical protein